MEVSMVGEMRTERMVCSAGSVGGKSIIKTENDDSRPCLALSLAVGHRYVVTFDSPTGPDI